MTFSHQRCFHCAGATGLHLSPSHHLLGAGALDCVLSFKRSKSSSGFSLKMVILHENVNFKHLKLIIAFWLLAYEANFSSGRHLFSFYKRKLRPADNNCAELIFAHVGNIWKGFSIFGGISLCFTCFTMMIFTIDL